MRNGNLTIDLEFGTEWLGIMHDLRNADGTVIPVDVQEDMALAYLDAFMEKNEVTPMSLVWGLTTIIRMLSATQDISEETLISLLRNTVQQAKEKYDD